MKESFIAIARMFGAWLRSQTDFELQSELLKAFEEGLTLPSRTTPPHLPDHPRKPGR